MAGSPFPARGEATVIQNGDQCLLVVDVMRDTAEKLAAGLQQEDFSRRDLAEAVENAARMVAFPGRMKRAGL